MELNWRDVYEHAVEAFGGQTPSAHLEASIVERFEASPGAVVAAVDKLAVRFTAGRVHSPWPLVLRELDQTPDRSSIRASDDSERERAFSQAERYIRQVGYLHQSEQELRDELVYRKWPVDDRLVELWRLVRPIGERTEREQLERAERWKSHARMHDAGSDPDADIAW